MQIWAVFKFQVPGGKCGELVVRESPECLQAYRLGLAQPLAAMVPPPLVLPAAQVCIDDQPGANRDTGCTVDTPFCMVDTANPVNTKCVGICQTDAKCAGCGCPTTTHRCDAAGFCKVSNVHLFDDRTNAGCIHPPHPGPQPHRATPHSPLCRPCQLARTAAHAHLMAAYSRAYARDPATPKRATSAR